MSYEGLDFETFSGVDIKTHGMYRYMDSPDFTVLCAAISNTQGMITYYDFVLTPDKAMRQFIHDLQHITSISAHNAGFERAVLQKMGINYGGQFIDSAVTARAMGAGSKLEAAAPQLLGEDKIELGSHLIKTFSVPTKENGGRPYTADELRNNPALLQQWCDFLRYCGVDADLSRKINTQYVHRIAPIEYEFEEITHQMNDIGWAVDLDLVHSMQELYQLNLAALEADFQARFDPDKELNFRSYQQLQRWCEARGVKAKSFDKTNLPKLINRVETRMHMPDLPTTPGRGTREELNEVLEMLKVKQERGGSSLTKLQTIIDLTAQDGRLKGQYLHVGAGQTYRTSGRGAQLQNLARLDEEIGDVEELLTSFAGEQWDNDKLTHNIRQVFKAEHPSGLLLVGDFKSVESRGLAYIAGEQWKLDAYRRGDDVYRRLATTYSSFNGVAYEDVTKQQRQGGKVGELACGYGAGAGAVHDFAERMGIFMAEGESAAIVADWRGACPATVQLWRKLDDMMHQALAGQATSYDIPTGGAVLICPIETPESLKKQHPGAQSIELRVYTPLGSLWLSRIFHGCYYRGRDVCYYRPSELKGGDLWRARMTTPPHQWYRLYGGKIAGILTQSFCRELFMRSLQSLHTWALKIPNVMVIGQFHDEIVLEWRPPTGTITSGEVQLDYAILTMEKMMSRSGPWSDFPLEADVKYAHRYIK
jgi:DNA polymerase